ncbi:ADAMTS-like protein 2 [Aplysia californica]|uniref:ADAMTS-like protein 2 n=1 Tax=Aplysia californica TaxID=6500 RepID=A0ABM1AG40_APLCA|nr:ADAMTS-like protein 2 [Aplysia californica]
MAGLSYLLCECVHIIAVISILFLTCYCDDPRLHPLRDPVYWGPWSSWSACSSSCGRGVTTKRRDCLMWRSVEVKAAKPWKCQGRDTRRRLCFSQACPGNRMYDQSVDDECQVLQHARRSRHRHRNWQRVDRGNPCRVVCAVIGGYTVRTLQVLPDGTVCSQNGARYAECNKGICKEVSRGCHDSDGTSLRLDMCLVCGGNNSSCDQVTGSFRASTSRTETYGFSGVVRIPQGATFINIVKEGDISSAIALLDSLGQHVPASEAGKRLPVGSNSFPAEGTNWLRERGIYRETLTATGPTVGDLTVVVSRRSVMELVAIC